MFEKFLDLLGAVVRRLHKTKDHRANHSEPAKRLAQYLWDTDPFVADLSEQMRVMALRRPDAKRLEEMVQQGLISSAVLMFELNEDPEWQHFTSLRDELEQTAFDLERYASTTDWGAMAWYVFRHYRSVSTILDTLRASSLDQQHPAVNSAIKAQKWLAIVFFQNQITWFEEGYTEPIED